MTARPFATAALALILAAIIRAATYVGSDR